LFLETPEERGAPTPACRVETFSTLLSAAPVESDESFSVPSL